MKKLLVIAPLLVLLAFAPTTNTADEEVKYKCLIQLSNYGGLGAYVIVSLTHPETGYHQTLSVSGDEPEWYDDLPEWFAYHEESGESIDGISGASIVSGGRKIVQFGIPQDLINSGYQLRFETAVEDNPYYPTDVEVALTDSLAGKNLEGNGYIRYVKLIGQ
ncbi:DUF2271 domain-containing protein [Marinoscillum pacificum]|uniref:DUF2271 domain-containing protein n=1 Tax=Marinoscillum pacificum TaxID=392723 RepID=UPI0021577863|nr:DUF2271 domain-containing protein [Marinoscillum pacificum]